MRRNRQASRREGVGICSETDHALPMRRQSSEPCYPPNSARHWTRLRDTPTAVTDMVITADGTTDITASMAMDMTRGRNGAKTGKPRQ